MIGADKVVSLAVDGGPIVIHRGIRQTDIRLRFGAAGGRGDVVDCGAEITVVVFG